MSLITDQQALEFHRKGKPGKVALQATKPLTSQADLSLAYSPGVAAPCLEIHKDPAKAYEYTAKGNYVAVITNGTAVLGLGDLGALASKPVMEGKAVLFKRFADIDAVDIEIDTSDPEEFINAVKYLGPSWGGINLEDIKAPECFIIESKLRELMDIPVFHDDQHGTAIITLAALINAAHLTNRDFNQMKVVVNGAGAAAIACIELIKAYGVKHENVILCDTKGTIYEGRIAGMNQWKEKHAVPTDKRTLAEAMQDADVFLGLSVKGAVTAEMVRSMADKPIIFAMANPDPEITPEEVKKVRDDAIIATGRSDYNNQVNNVMGFPYIFRGALDVQASTINDEMKIAAAKSLAMLARAHVPDEVSQAYSGRSLEYGTEYIIPVPFDPRLICEVPIAVAKAAMESGVARKPITDIEQYRIELSERLDPTASSMNLVFQKAKNSPKRVVFAEGEEDSVIRAALTCRDAGYCIPILVGVEDVILNKMKQKGFNPNGIQIVNSLLSKNVEKYIDFYYAKNQRKGQTYRDCNRLVKHDRNIFAGCMVELDDADAMVTGVTRGYIQTYDTVSTVIDKTPNAQVVAMSIIIINGRAIFISDTGINELPCENMLADIAIQTAAQVKKLGFEPKVAMIAYSNFGNPVSYKRSEVIRKAVEVLNSRNVNFEYDGEMSADIALNMEMRKLYPFCKLSGPANILIMPSLRTANISAKLLQELGGASVIGPILCGLDKSVQIAPMGASVSDIINLAALASINAS
jgi:malate dehydrogenase (oxaloacetate-decarboxylating)(NADP+)